MKTPSQQVEAIAAGHVAEKLRVRMENHQREIANLCAGVCPLQAQSNLLGQMSQHLTKRSYPDVRQVLAHWQEFADLVEAMLKSMQETSMLVRGFCEFFEETNGVWQGEVG